MGWTTQHTHSNGLDNVMGSTDGLAMAVNQVAKPWVRDVVAVGPCKGLDFSSQQLHGATTPVMEDRCRSTTTTLQGEEWV